MPKYIDIMGQRFGRLVVTEQLNCDKHRQMTWRCLCDCGKFTKSSSYRLRRGSTNSCGCSRRIHNAKSRTKEYQTWRSMIKRCCDSQNASYKYYGARGITVCKRWHEFENFRRDMGNQPHNQSLDRIDNNAPYSPQNCRWTTAHQQSRNRRSTRLLTHDGKTLCVTDWAPLVKIDRQTILARLYRGWSAHDALTKPLRKLNHRVQIIGC
jgi:hypothetical protein